ncbi:hypothetical protein BZZ01_04780 [Nostocales cyanobacterium HT-58-2]|nr:hypothetical protein BZZ01_04780 [Nostocales cyanobacterium HT-58-2]
MQASQNLAKGRVDYVTGELQIVSDLSKSDRQRRDIAQTIAATRLRSLDQQLALEQKVLDLNLAQQAAQLEQEKIRNRVSQSQNVAEVAKAQADLAKLRVDSTATPEAIQAAQLGVRAKVEEGISLQFAGALLQQQSDIQRTLGSIERQNLQERSGLQRDQAQVEYAKTLSPREQGELLGGLREQALQKSFGVSRDAIAPTMDAFLRQTTDMLRRQPVGLEPLQQYYAGLANQQFLPTQPSLQVQFPDFEQFRQNQLARLQEFGYRMPSPSRISQDAGQTGLMEAVQKLTDLVNQKLGQPSAVTQQNEINNYFNQETTRVGDTVTQQIRRSLYELGKELGR